jgi:RHH-type proline utilization regulon transcriptional repressor/proline dehydrogenase/delta 1-pyrroline-5-carboxylate dehydrogenase
MMQESAVLERRIQEIGRQLFADAAHYRRGLSRQAVDMRLLEWAMQDDAFKVQLFRFVDVLPVLHTSESAMTHLRDYLLTPGAHLPLFGRAGEGVLKMLAGGGLAAQALLATVRSQVTGMARHFIAGANVPEALAGVHRLRKDGMLFTLDLLGEVTVSETEAEAYQAHYLALLDALTPEVDAWPKAEKLDQIDRYILPRLNVSLKLSALSAQIDPADPDGAVEKLKARLRPILTLAKTRRAFVNLDMEHYALKAITLRVFHELANEPEFRGWPHVGIVLQAYLRDTEYDARALIDSLQGRAPTTVRLVKGAYWDAETVLARQRNWPLPVYAAKHETDAAFERLAAVLLDQYPHIRLAVASHNVRSLAAVMAMAEARDLPVGAVEYQMLYGMGDQLKHAMLAQEQRLRVYTPFGELLPGMAYLVRRLLENTANTSFLRQSFHEGAPAETLLRNPAELPPVEPHPVQPGFPNVPERNYALAAHREEMQAALARVRQGFGDYFPLVIGGQEVRTKAEIISTDPARPGTVIGRTASAGTAEADQAIAAAADALPGWRATPPAERANLLRRTADLVAQWRDDLAALQVYEVGKNWREADADVCETIDYLRYYAAEMERLGDPQRLGRLPGETNDYHYEGKGIALVLSPWNFPMAICAGMTSAALVAGNTVIVKPASQSPLIAAAFVDLLVKAGAPAGAVNYLPGPGAEVGDYLVRHPAVNLIAFTGSREVGSRIFRQAAEVVPGQNHLKKVIAEMGGKNAVIVDSDADLDDAVLGVVQSAFGYQGQKCSACSRAIVLAPIYDRFVSRLVEAVRSLTIGHPEDPGNYMGPVIDARAKENILRFIEVGKLEGTLALQREVADLGGHFVGPTIFTDVPPEAVIAREEIFGPVLAVMKAQDFSEALRLATSTNYALTGGLYSRLPSHIEQAKREFRVGNLYINRKITGAIVARQPFGGFKLSGIGSKAGGPDYLLQFLDPRTITENTMRRGFAPEE